MVRVQTIVQLTPELVEALDAVAARSGRSRSAIIRSAVEAHLAEDRERAIDDVLVRAYTAIPQGATDAWGPVLEPLRANTRRTLGRLDEEEYGAGLEW